ncbi:MULTISPECIES: ABC transporter permease [unclassified Leifsonia]|uniref:ABC transporter permease n=1 Tax=unclassified Leifsonia TaxID=2663824 RepID=UPI0008A75881|nr:MULTISPECIES: ABC transporter permease [unclassified Leifsonia]SEH99729.1 MacB-like core domain-containing protein [Leifsonia sp. CL154]SFL67559.1 MacB-like core domain-containing protein [Leifsonia sp. CL147]
MFGTYLRRELLNRRKQTIIIATGMALAIALVIIVDATSAGVKQAQASVLESVYGVGTDITVSEPVSAAASGGGPKFQFGAGDGTDTGGSRQIDSARLIPERGTSTMDAKALDTIQKVGKVTAAASVLSLTNLTFSGTLPSFDQQAGGAGGPGGGSGGKQVFIGGADGAGGSAFDVDSFSVLGLDPAGRSVGPLAAVTTTAGRTFTAADAGNEVAVLDSSYAKTSGKAVGDMVTIGGKDFTVIGTVASTDSGLATASNAYIPLDVAQELSGQTGKVSSVYVSAASSDDVAQVESDLAKALPGVTVNTQADLASTVSGSLGTAGGLISNLGTWLSIIVLAAAFLIAILFTISGVTRRTREFGTLKAIGWSNRRIVGQVAGESVVQGLIGGLIGVAAGILGIVVINLIAPTLTGTLGSSSADAGPVVRGADGATGGGGLGGGGPFEALRKASETSADVTLHAPVTVWIIVAAVALAVLGGLLAGAVGGWRASRLRPAAALRSVA